MDETWVVAQCWNVYLGKIELTALSHSLKEGSREGGEGKGSSLRMIFIRKKIVQKVLCQLPEITREATPQ